jgi:glycerol-3-phosphate dehydrogenase (NAD(P)+)
MPRRVLARGLRRNIVASMRSIGIIGGGAWGTAIAQVLSSAGRDVLLWAREDEVVSSINEIHENKLFLPGITLDKTLKATNDIGAVSARDIVLLVPPTQFLRSTLQQIKNNIGNKIIVLCCKGVEIGTGLLPSQIASEVLPGADIAVLTGPTFAAEAARGLPFAVTLAAKDSKISEILKETLATRKFRLYASNDIIGAQIGGAIKNVIAIACGVVHGKKLGENARAAILSRGLAEIARLAVAMGGRHETLMGLCGVGDLTLTASSLQSRNFSLGAGIGEGKTADEILGARKSVTEGVYTAQAALSLAAQYKVDMPITAAVNDCIHSGVSVDSAIEALLNRRYKEEFE